MERPLKRIFLCGFPNHFIIAGSGCGAVSLAAKRKIFKTYHIIQLQLSQKILQKLSIKSAKCTVLSLKPVGVEHRQWLLTILISMLQQRLNLTQISTTSKTFNSGGQIVQLQTFRFFVGHFFLLYLIFHIYFISYNYILFLYFISKVGRALVLIWQI